MQKGEVDLLQSIQIGMADVLGHKLSGCLGLFSKEHPPIHGYRHSSKDLYIEKALRHRRRH
jgi:hypothetical protein